MSKKQPKEVRVEALLNAAVEEFLEKGYEGASVNAIAVRAGVSKGGFYHHFPNKETLLMEANRKLSEPVLEMMERAYSSQSALDGLKLYMREYLEYWSRHTMELSFFFLSMAKALASEILMDYYREYITAVTDFFTDMFRKAAQVGELKVKDPGISGITLMGALDGVLSHILVHPEVDIAAFAESMGRIWTDKE